MEGKKGQNMTLSTIILIVLGLVVLVFLIYGFSTGWGNLWQKITGLGGGKVNVDTVVTACTLACESERQYDFCQDIKTVNYADGTWEKGSCAALAGVVATNSNTNRQLDIEASGNINIGKCNNLCDGVVVEKWANSKGQVGVAASAAK